jgi:hypothetical protein
MSGTPGQAASSLKGLEVDGQTLGWWNSRRLLAILGVETEVMLLVSQEAQMPATRVVMPAVPAGEGGQQLRHMLPPAVLRQ